MIIFLPDKYIKIAILTRGFRKYRKERGFPEPHRYTENKMKIQNHPTHRKKTIIGIIISTIVIISGGSIAVYTDSMKNADFLSMIGVSLFFIGCIGFIIWSLYCGLYLRCPSCKKFIFKWGISHPAPKIFECKHCNVLWDSGQIVGGPD